MAYTYDELFNNTGLTDTGGTTYAGGGTAYPGYNTGYTATGATTRQASKPSRKWAGDYTFYDKLYEEALKDIETEGQNADYWMDQEKDTWEQEGDWLNQRPGQYTWDESGKPVYQDFDPSKYIGPEAYNSYQDQASRGLVSYDDQMAQFNKLYGDFRKSGAGNYAGWQDVTMDAFDADAAFNKYVEGANTRFKGTLYDELEALQQTAAGRGRLNTGFFDLDTGDLSRRLSSEARADAQMKALDTNNQQLGYITAKANLGVANNQGRLDAYLGAGRLAEGWANTYAGIANNYNQNKLGANELAARMLGDDRNFASDTHTKNYDAKRSAYQDDRNFSMDAWRNNYDAWADTAGIYGDRSTRAHTGAPDWRDRYMDSKTGLRQEWLGREEAAKDRKAGKDASKRQMWGEIAEGAMEMGSKLIPIP